MYRKQFFLSLSFLFILSTVAFSQTTIKQKSSNRLSLKSLKLSIQVDTSTNSYFYINDDMLVVQFKKDYFFELLLTNEPSKIKELKSEFRNDEFPQTIDNKHELVKYSDSSSFKLNGVTFWKVRKSWRPVPTYWTEMYEKKKLNSQQLTDYVNSDKQSWQKSNSAIIYYGENPKTKNLFLLSGGFRNEGELPTDFEERLKKIVLSIKLL